MAAALVGDPGAGVSAAGTLAETLRGVFYKLTGSGNDFVFFDARATGQPAHVPTQVIRALCARGQGVGADGVVFLDQSAPDAVRIAYYNSDGTRAALCGNATLCTATLAVHLGAVPPGSPFLIHTDAGILQAQVDPSSGPSFMLGAVRQPTLDVPDALAGEGAAREVRAGYAVAGVPHVVVRVPDASAVRLGERGPILRAPSHDRPDGANVNYVSLGADGAWDMRTFERGVEGETLACGTGAAACATVLRAWGEAGDTVVLRTRSGRPLTVELPSGADAERGPVLAGEGRLVFTGSLRDWQL